LVRDPLGRRLVSRITEVVGMEGDLISTADLFTRSPVSLTDHGDPAPLVSTGLCSARLGSRNVVAPQ
jgi:hypothetical protein